MAKEIATIDQLFPERLIMGVSSGDRRADFHGLNIHHEDRGQRFIEAFQYLNQVLYEEFPSIHSSLGAIQGSNLVPKPTKRIPTMDYRILTAINGMVREKWRWMDVLS